MAIYRVTVKTTGSVQPGRGATFWDRSAVYCGTSLEDARIVFLRERVSDYWAGHGNRARETVIEQFESEPDEIDSTDATEVEPQQ